MKNKFGTRLCGFLLTVFMILGALQPVFTLPTNAEGSGGLTADSKYGESGNILFTVDDSGVLTWSAVSGATSYDLNIWVGDGLFKSETGLTVRSYDLEAKLDQYKKDSGSVKVTINSWSGSGSPLDGDTVYFMYRSSLPKLEAPSDLKWDVNGNADWDDVANADGYTLYLYQPSGGAYNHYDLADSYFNCTNYPDVATRISDGWYFAVRATSTGSYRPSEYNESYRRGHVIGSGLTAGTTWGNNGIVKFTVTDTGSLNWSEVPGATSYDLNIWMGDGLFRAVNGLTSRFYALQEELNNARKDSGTVRIALIPKGNNVADKSDGVYLLYSSPYGKLEAPTDLYWNGNMAGWSAVDGAESYTVYLYQPGGSGYNHWTTTDTYFDFSSVATIGEDWFFAVKATASNARDSVYNESPRYTGPVSTTLYTIGAYAYDGTNGVMDSGGQVYLETNVGVVDWTSSGETMLAIEGTAVTVKAAPTPGYVFVEWRQGTQGATISREAEYSFTATGDKFLYAIFRDKGDYEIAEVVGKISSDRIPRAGMEVSRFIPNIPDGATYGRYWNGSEWRDENGVLISANIGHHYDLGYEFEAGRSYTTDGFYFEANSGYTFAENATVHLMGPERSMWDYEVTGFNDDHTVMFVRFTFRIPGDRTYPDINKVSMVYYGTHADGGEMPDPARLIYNNCAITREEWNTGSWGSACAWDTSTGENRFEAGNTYVHMIELTALPGYKFSENLLAQKGMQGDEEYGVVSLSDDRTVATVTYTYDITDIEYLNTVTLEAKAGDENYYLVRQGDNNAGGLPFTTAYTLKDQVYEIRFENYFDWYDVETGKKILSITNTDLEVGKKYRLEFDVMIKDEFDETHRFGENPALVLKDYQCANANFVQIETDCDAGATQMRVSITYTAQPKPGEGSGAHYPIVCYSYREFKYAMENEDIRYVALGDVDETMPAGEEGLVTAIRVNGIKTLNLLGDATFTAPASAVTTYAALLHVTQYNTLNISGAGSLTFEAVASNSYNAVIYNQGGSVNISGGTLIGSYNTAVYGKAIWQEYGELRISGGQLLAENALAPGSLPGAATAVYIHGGNAWIEGGTFRTDNVIDTIDLPYGLDIGQYATVDLSGGTFHGILLPTSSTPLANYMDEELYTPLSNESWFNPESEYSQEYVESGKVVRIAWLIDHVDIHINAPIAGVDITENYFNIPTSGCKVTMYYPQWYKNGVSVTYGTFEAGASYKVVVWVDAKADYGAEFTNGVTVAINNQSVAVDRKSEHLIAVEYDFGACPNVVPQVDLTVTAPVEGNTPSYTIGCGSDAYYAVGGSSNYTDYRRWYESSDGYDWWEINTSSKFKSGYYYKLYVDIRTNNGYEFPLIDNGTIQPNVSATVNGYYANVIKAYEQDPSRYITVEYNFGECNDSVVESITITNIDAPVAGQTPDYLANCFGTGYSMAGTNSGNWKVNGIVWLRDGDNYTGSIMDKTEKFQAGHEYTVMIDLVADDGYTFLFNHGNSIYAAASINGNTAQINLENCSANQYDIWYTFTCEAKEITTIMLYDLDRPVGGNTPDTSVTPAYPEYYVVESVKWFDIEDNPAGDIFESGVPYYALITVAAANTDVIFADIENLTVYLDGNLIDASSVEDNKVTIPVIIRKPASAPEMTIYAFTTQPNGGTLSIGETLPVDWQTSFIPTDTEIQYWDGEAWDQWDIQQAQGAQDSYDFVNAEAASYRFRIVAYIGDDVVATSNEFVITWEDETEYIYLFGPGEGQGSNWYDYATSGTQITLEIPASVGIYPIDGFEFDYWSIRYGAAMNPEAAQKLPGETITLTDDTYIIAIWKEAPLSEFIYVYGPGEGQGSNEFEYVTNGTQITLEAPASVGIYPIEGFEFDYWSIRVGGPLADETARKQAGETIIINDDTYIIAIWKEAAPSTFTVAYGIGEGSGSADFETDIAFGSNFTLKAFNEVGIIAPVGKMFDYWSIRVGTALSEEVARKQAGDTIIINDDTYIIAIWKPIPDINMDGIVDAGDAETILKYIAGWDVTVDEAVLDVNGDGKINVRDAATILLCIAQN